MAAKKFYAVKKGKTPGIFGSWQECKASVDGFPKAEYKGFATLEEARAYLGEKPDESILGENNGRQHEQDINGQHGQSAEEQGTGGQSKQHSCRQKSEDLPVYHIVDGRLLTYVDGSYHDGLKRYAFGCVFLLPEHEIRIAYGNGNNPQSLQHRNVTGEMLGAMYAVKTAMKNGYREIELCYDYEGIEKWVTGAWRSKTELTGQYAQSMREWGKSIRIIFTKVEAHSKVAYNELADQTAKRGLTEGDGIPKIGDIRELELYEG